MKQIIVFILISYLTFVSAFAEANDKYLKFDLLSMADGLSQNSITCLYQDSFGYLWIGTQSGLNRYDGIGFKVFKNEPLDPNTISNNFIHNIVEDKNGNLWIATEYGLNMYDRKTGYFISYYSDSKNNNSISDNKIYSVNIDKQGYIWIKTLRFLDRLNPITKEIRTFEHYFDLFNPIAENCIFPILETSAGELFVGTNDGLNLFDRKYEQFIRFNHEPLNKFSISNNEIRFLYEDSKGTLWVATSNGLNRFNPKSRTFDSFFYSDDIYKGNLINSIAEDVSGDLWIATTSYGLLKFNIQKKEFVHFMSDEYSTGGLVSNDINSLWKDNSDILWIGTRAGLNKLDIKKKKFKTFKTGNKSLYKLSGNNITAVFYHNEENLLIGTKNSGLNVLNLNTKDVKIFSESNKNILSNQIYSIKKVDDNIIIGTGDGAYIYDNKLSLLKKFTSIYPCKNLQLLYGKKITSIHQATNGNIWLGTNVGLMRYNRSDEILTVYSHDFNDKSTISSNEVNCIFEDGKGNIWIGTNYGLNRFEPSVEIFERIVYENNSNQGLSHNSVYAINQDSYGNLWIGTGAGLDMYDIKTGLFFYYTEKHGLPNNQIYSISKYKDDFWIATNKGVAKFNNQTHEIRNYDISDGLQGYEFNVASNFVAPHGEIFIGGISGLNSFYPDSISDNTIIPKVVITAFNLFGKDIRSNFSVDGRERIQLPYESHSFRIEFAALEFTQPKQNSYKYIMEGLGKEWISSGNVNYANFSNVPSGEYTFKVIASNNDQIWNLEPVTLSITIETPFWKQPIAYIIYFITLSILIYIFIEYRTSKLKKINKILTEKQLAAIEIAKQKEQLSIKNKNIMDSINYAKRIQRSIMPSRSKFANLIPESFILYLPKDIVSGDFYWITEIDNKIFIASVDCTGHGVPGAFMSIIGFDLLRNITKERKIHNPAEVLDELNTLLIELLTKNIVEGEVKDGMDIALCVFHKDKGILEFAGALNPLYIIRNNKIMTTRGDRFCVGLGNEHKQDDFKNHVLKLQKGDRIYIFSDGYADQFGGPNGKKMKYRRFRHLLLSIHNLSFEQQCSYLEQHLDTWKGQLEQVDDILVIGMSFDNYLEQ